MPNAFSTYTSLYTFCTYIGMVSVSRVCHQQREYAPRRTHGRQAISKSHSPLFTAFSESMTIRKLATRIIHMHASCTHNAYITQYRRVHENITGHLMEILKFKWDIPMGVPLYQHMHTYCTFQPKFRYRFPVCCVTCIVHLQCDSVAHNWRERDMSHYLFKCNNASLCATDSWEKIAQA